MAIGTAAIALFSTISMAKSGEVSSPPEFGFLSEMEVATVCALHLNDLASISAKRYSATHEGVVTTWTVRRFWMDHSIQLGSNIEVLHRLTKASAAQEKDAVGLQWIYCSAVGARKFIALPASLRVKLAEQAARDLFESLELRGLTQENRKQPEGRK